jgi:uncharacterized surface protein with fasciclin (FAS1) repeats
MKRSTLRRSTGLAALAMTMSMGLAACGGGEEPAASSGSAGDSSSEESMSDESMSEDSMDESMEGDAAAMTFGEGCSAVPSNGAGSFDGMATEPVATAASANPLLKTLVSAVDQAGLVDTLNSAEGITVFAPTDDAFGKIPKKTLDGVLKDKETLTAILTHHVVGEELAPEDLAGTHETLNGDQLVVEGSGEQFTADAQEQASVICGNIQTANATVYVVDTVMMPKM